MTTSETQLGHVGDWNVNLAQNVQPGQSRTVQSLIPQTTYQIRWEAVGYAPEDITPGNPTTITTTPPEVDASIQNAGDTAYIGQGVWSLDGDGETKSQWVKVGDTATYNIQVTNSEPYSDDFHITGPGSDTKWTVSYFDSQGQNITTQVRGAGYTARGLGAGQTCALSVEVAPNQGVADGDTKDVLVTATIGSDTTQQDAVLASTMAVSQTIAKLQYSLDGQVTWNDVPQPGDLGYPLTVNQGDYVDFQAVKSDPNADWPDGKPVWSGSDWGGEIGESSWEAFNEVSQDNNDLKQVAAECHNIIAAKIKVNSPPALQSIAKLRYSLDSGTTWSDMPQPGDTNYPLTVTQGDNIAFEAVKANTDFSWPDDEPVWGGLAGPQHGEFSWVWMEDYSRDDNDLKSISVECGNKVSGNVKVRRSYFLSVWSDQNDILVGGGDLDLANANVTAVVEDWQGNPIAGVNVNFLSTDGNNNPMGVIGTSATTNADGEAQVVLTSGMVAQCATIKASAMAPDGTALEDIDYVNFNSAEGTVEIGGWQNVNGILQAPCTITLSYEGEPVANRSVSLTSSVATDEDGNQLAQGYEDATDFENANLITDSNGVATTYLRWHSTDPPDNFYVFVDVYDKITE